MDEVAGNPQENRLAHGVTDESLREAVEASGYPLQTVVAADLRTRDFAISEEWVFNDRDTGQLRALDIHATQSLYDERSEGGRRVRPQLALLVECKRSEMPYVFFASHTRPGYGAAAISVAGLHEDRVTVRTDDDLSTWSFSTLQALGFSDHAFVAEPPSVALSFSKAARRNKDLVLSGEDPYQSLVRPLTKALDSYTARLAPPSTAVYFDLVVPIGLAIIDGPMVQAEVTAESIDYKLCPWIRVYRHDVDDEAGHRFEREKLHAIDCVHSAWLESYLTDHLLPFAKEFGRRALEHHEEIASGAAFASGFGRDSHSGLPGRLLPLSPKQRARRPRQLAKNLASQRRDLFRSKWSD